MIRKQTPKIKESEKIITFNRLIEDANRRLVKKNQMLINENINEKKKNENKKKFNQIDFENKYNEKITQRLKEKELKLELLRNQKKKEEKDKEDFIVEQMKKRKTDHFRSVFSLVNKWRRRWDSNPRTAFGDQTISSRSRYDHFDTSPYNGHIARKSTLLFYHISRKKSTRFEKYAEIYLTKRS